VVFAREITDPLTGLVKKIDAATAKNNKVASFVVFMNDDESYEQKLKDLAKKEQLTTTTLTLDNPAGPKGYNIAKEADVTVLLYVNKTVKHNYAFKKGELKDTDVAAIVGEFAKME
jgi:hypothetical protein